MNLYELNQAVEEAFYNSMDPETGEILNSDELDALTLARDEKVENIALFIKNLKAEAEAIKAEEKRLSERRKTCENRAEWLKGYLQKNLDGEKFKTAKVSISYRKTQSVNVTDIWKIPTEFLKIADPTPDKVAIKEALKAGKAMEGAELVDNISMTIK